MKKPAIKTLITRTFTATGKTERFPMDFKTEKEYVQAIQTAASMLPNIQMDIERLN